MNFAQVNSFVAQIMHLFKWALLEMINDWALRFHNERRCEGLDRGKPFALKFNFIYF